MKLSKLKYWYVAVLILLFATACDDSAVLTEYNIIPEPVYIVQKGRIFTISTSTKLCFENLAQNSPTAKLITNTLRKKHVRPALIGQPTKNCITFTINDTVNTALGDEGYLLQVKPEGIFISANTEAGLFYGFVTFVQMLPPDIRSESYSRVTLPECTILDYPRFAWRGSHLDCCRHFMSVREIKLHLDIMSAYKLNKFHWHLSDDQGWRIETDQFPQLNDIGSWRVDRSRQPWGMADSVRPNEEPTYGGFYSKEDIREIVEYASARNIEVIPEIELTSHCSAILAAYPELSCPGKSHAVALGPCWPDNALLCAGNDKALNFIQQLLDEVCELFPGEYIHIGVDECSLETWEQCPRCQARMRQKGFNDERQLQGWLVWQIEQMVEKHGKRILGWDDLLECHNISPTAVVIATRGDTNVSRAAFRGNGVIAAPPEFCNLDSYQADTHYHPLAAPQFLSLQKVYQYDPMPQTLAHNVQGNLLGGVQLLWTGFTSNYSEAQYMLLPRLCAIAECLWTPSDKKSWSSFRQRIEKHKTSFKSRKLNYCPGSFRPVVVETPSGANVVVDITTEVANTYIYYTLDGSEPTPESAIYHESFTAPRGTLLRTLTLYNGVAQEGIYNFVL